MPYSIWKILIIVSIQVAIAMIHALRLGQVFSGELHNLYYSYFSDLALPFGAYFLLSLSDASIPILRRWYVKAGIVFSVATFAEFCQLFGIELLGKTFDPVDVLAYAAGVSIAAFVDVKIFAPNLGFWVTTKAE